MKNTNIIISIDTRRPKKDGSYPVIMRLAHNERTTSIPIGFSVLEKDWDADKKIVKKSYVGLSSVSRLNNLIQKKKSEAMDIVLKLHESGKLNTLPVTSLRREVEKDQTNHSFFKYGETQVTNLVQANRIGTARSYKEVLSILKKYNGKDIAFNDITYPFLTKFEIFHKSKGNSINGLAVYMRTIRAIYNKAIKDGRAEKEQYPFDVYKIKTLPTQKRALDFEFLKKIIDFKLEPGHALFNARNYFLASYMMYGMNFTDMAFLQKTDIENSRIFYRRKKTSKVYDIKITDNLKTILDYYTNDFAYVFPIIKRDTAILQSKDIQWARKRYNAKLKKLAELCGIDSNLTSYVSRHSFATQAMMRQVPLNAISAMLGHSSLKTTEIYLKGLPSSVLDDYNSTLLSNF